MLVNEYRLNLADSRARRYLTEQTERHFFGEGAEVAVGLHSAGKKMKAKIRWIGGVAFQADSGGHQITIDGAPEFGGRNLGPRPMETVLIGTAACAAF